MTKIPAWGFAIIGIAVSIYTKFIQSRRPESPIKYFFWIGIALTIYGVARFLIEYMTGKKEPKRGSQSAVPQRNIGNSLICPRCNAKLHPQSRYCNWCGAKQ